MTTVLCSLPPGREVFGFLPTFLVVFRRRCCKFGHLFQGLFFTASRRPGAIEAHSTPGRKISVSFDGLVKPRGPRSPLWVGLGAAGAGLARSPRETVEGTVEKARGQRFQSFHEGFVCEAEGIEVLSSCLAFLDSGSFSRLLLVPGTRKGSGFSSRGGSQGSCRCSGAVWPPGIGGGAREVLLAPPLALARRAPSG